MPVQYVLSCPKVAGNSNGWPDLPSKKEANKKGGEKTMGGKIKKIKKRKKKFKKKEKRRSQQNKRKEREGRGEEDRMKNRKEKERKKS